MTALGLPYPTIVGKVAGGEWASTVMDRVVAEGRYGVRLGQSPDDAADGAAGVHRGRVRRAPVPARPPGVGRDHRRAVRVRARPVGPSAARRRSRASRRGVTGPPPVAARRAVRRGHAAVRQRGRHAVRDLRARATCGSPMAPTSRVPLAEVEACARVLAAWVVDGARHRLTRRPARRSGALSRLGARVAGRATLAAVLAATSSTAASVARRPARRRRSPASTVVARVAAWRSARYGVAQGQQALEEASSRSLPGHRLRSGPVVRWSGGGVAMDST